MLIPHSYKGLVFHQTDEEIIFSTGVVVPRGYCNATEMTKAASIESGKRKEFGKWFKKESTQEYLQVLAEDIGTTIDNKTVAPNGASAQYQGIQPLIIVNKGGSDVDQQGIWIHPDVGTEYTRWLNPKFSIYANRVILGIMNGDAVVLSEALQEQVNKARNEWNKTRVSGKITRRKLTDAIQDYLKRHEELSINYVKWVYANATDAMYSAVFGVTAVKLEKLLGCDRHQSRDFLNAECLKKIDWAEESICNLIDKRDKEPVEAVQLIVDLFGIEPIKPVGKGG